MVNAKNLFWALKGPKLKWKKNLWIKEYKLGFWKGYRNQRKEKGPKRGKERETEREKRGREGERREACVESRSQSYPKRIFEEDPTLSRVATPPHQTSTAEWSMRLSITGPRCKTVGKRGSSFTHGLLSLPKSGVLASRYLPELVPYLGKKNKK